MKLNVIFIAALGLEYQTHPEATFATHVRFGFLINDRFKPRRAGLNPEDSLWKHRPKGEQSVTLKPGLKAQSVNRNATELTLWGSKHLTVSEASPDKGERAVHVKNLRDRRPGPRTAAQGLCYSIRLPGPSGR